MKTHKTPNKCRGRNFWNPFRLGLVAFALTLTAPSGSKARVSAARTAGRLLARRMVQRNARDLRWLKKLVHALATGKATRNQVIKYLGRDAGKDPNNPTHRRVKPHSRFIKRAVVYPLTHIGTPVAMDIYFTTAGRPTFAALKKLLGRFRPVPRNPGDFRSGPRFAHYFTPKGSKTTVRVFAELTRSKQRVVKLFLDAYTDSK